MNVVLLFFLAFRIRAELFDSLELTNEAPTSDENFQKELEEGYQLLKDEPLANETKWLVEQLHKMEPEIKRELTLSPARNAELQKQLKNYVKIENDHVPQFGGTIEEINTESKVGRALFQGDILLTRKQAEEILEDVRENEGKRKKRQAFRDSSYPFSTWSNGFSFTFSNTIQAVKRVFRKAALIWEAETCIDFREDSEAEDKVVVHMGGGCFSSIGRVGGVQYISLGKDCTWVGLALHEIGHALGFFHTQSRHDRDDFISMDWHNFKPQWVSQFAKQTEHTNYNYNLTYDYGSVMHYGATGVSRNGQPAVFPRDPKYTQTLGSHMISFYEKLMMNLHYKCLDRCKSGSSAKCKNGGFPHPRDCSKCTCPSGYGGRLCDERPSGCGRTLTATTSYQTLEDTVGERGASYARDAFMMCHYWIQAPAGSTIEVVLDSYPSGVAVDGCHFAGVEIKTGSDKRHTGYRFCSPRYAGTSLVSTHNIVPIITYSRVYERKTVLRYRIASMGTGTTDTETSETTGSTDTESPKESTPRPTRLTTPTNGRCKDLNLCDLLMEWDFCNDDNYDNEVKYLACPKSCNLC